MCAHHRELDRRRKRMSESDAPVSRRKTGPQRLRPRRKLDIERSPELGGVDADVRGARERPRRTLLCAPLAHSSARVPAHRRKREAHVEARQALRAAEVESAAGGAALGAELVDDHSLNVIDKDWASMLVDIERGRVVRCERRIEPLQEQASFERRRRLRAEDDARPEHHERVSWPLRGQKLLRLHFRPAVRIDRHGCYCFAHESPIFARVNLVRR
mmetsp:Transcript_1097/g.4059  ORF Transcript_1097/g.4059 Transcript_1097/m.4059 type:complete len:216 (-) Transcript_1097:1127-1774(-)